MGLPNPSRETKFSGANGDKEIFLLRSADREQDWQLSSPYIHTRVQTCTCYQYVWKCEVRHMKYSTRPGGLALDVRDIYRHRRVSGNCIGITAAEETRIPSAYCCCCCCCLHIKSRSGLYSVLSNIRTGPTDADAFRGHRLTTQKGYTYQKEIKGPRKVNTHAIIGK